MGMLHSRADLHKQTEPFWNGELVLIAKLECLSILDVFREVGRHHESLVVPGGGGRLLAALAQGRRLV
jgi:hypothetical protein